MLAAKFVAGPPHKEIRSALFWNITQHIVANPYQRFRITYRYLLQCSRNAILEFSTLEDVVPKHRQGLLLYAARYPRRPENSRECCVFQDYYPDLIANDSVAFLRQSKQYFSRKPVMLVLSFPAPHGPEDSAPQFSHLFFNVTTHQ
jgi:hypothetical protein